MRRSSQVVCWCQVIHSHQAICSHTSTWGWGNITNMWLSVCSTWKAWWWFHSCSAEQSPWLLSFAYQNFWRRKWGHAQWCHLQGVSGGLVSSPAQISVSSVDILVCSGSHSVWLVYLQGRRVTCPPCAMCSRTSQGKQSALGVEEQIPIYSM